MEKILILMVLPVVVRKRRKLKEPTIEMWRKVSIDKGLKCPLSVGGAFQNTCFHHA